MRSILRATLSVHMLHRDVSIFNILVVQRSHLKQLVTRYLRLESAENEKVMILVTVHSAPRDCHAEVDAGDPWRREKIASPAGTRR